MTFQIGFVLKLNPDGVVFKRISIGAVLVTLTTTSEN
jgi:hypothetical protein